MLGNHSFTPGQQGKVLARIAIILPVSCSSFCAEVLALDNALEIIPRLSESQWSKPGGSKSGTSRLTRCMESVSKDRMTWLLAVFCFFFFSYRICLCAVDTKLDKAVEICRTFLLLLFPSSSSGKDECRDNSANPNSKITRGVRPFLLVVGLLVRIRCRVESVVKGKERM